MNVYKVSNFIKFILVNFRTNSFSCNYLFSLWMLIIINENQSNCSSLNNAFESTFELCLNHFIKSESFNKFVSRVRQIANRLKFFSLS